MSNSSQQSLFAWADSVDKSKSRADQIFASFIKFHRANPIIWDLFQQYALKAIASGREHYSADCICHLIRWYWDIEMAKLEGEDCKLNNNYTAYYARLFQAKHPESEGFFRNRKRISQDVPAHDNDLKVFIGGSPEAEEALLAQLADL